MLSQVEELDALAETAAHMEATPGRAWRSLEDTAIAAQVLYGSPDEWRSLRRSVDYYPEGLLIWLEADVLIRRQTEGRASLDDFCRRFFGGVDGPAEVRPYDLGHVVGALNAIAPRDWAEFFRARVMGPTVPARAGAASPAEAAR